VRREVAAAIETVQLRGARTTEGQHGRAPDKGAWAQSRARTRRRGRRWRQGLRTQHAVGTRQECTAGMEGSTWSCLGRDGARTWNAARSRHEARSHSPPLAPRSKEEAAEPTRPRRSGRRRLPRAEGNQLRLVCPTPELSCKARANRKDGGLCLLQLLVRRQPPNPQGGTRTTSEPPGTPENSAALSNARGDHDATLQRQPRHVQPEFPRLEVTPVGPARVRRAPTTRGTCWPCYSVEVSKGGERWASRISPAATCDRVPASSDGAGTPGEPDVPRARPGSVVVESCCEWLRPFR